jgi:tRNA-2-methylthio-N6-dimethylallyladenosine synthase
MNEYDSQLIKSICRSNGFGLAGSVGEAERAHAKIYGRLQSLKREKLLRKNGELVIGLLGCMAQNLKNDLLDGHDHLDFIVGPDNYRKLPGLIADARDQGGQAESLKLSKTETYSGIDPLRSGGVNAWLAVMRGCDNMCAFCVVPYTRGRERSRDSANIIDEVKALAGEGYKQVTLLGQNVNSYRHDGVRFADLMRMVADVPGIERVRFTAPHPKDFPVELIDAIAEHPKLCKHIHLPLQAGSDRILELMRRTYTNQIFRDLVARMREVIPGLGLTTDVIVGFPTETDDEYEDTRRLMEDVRFDSAFIFKYSERKGTYAQRTLEDDVGAEAKTRRIIELVDLQKRITNEINKGIIGTVQSVLIEERAEKYRDTLMGRTDNFKTTLVPAASYEAGDLIDVIIDGARGATLFARDVDSAAYAT